VYRPFDRLPLQPSYTLISRHILLILCCTYRPARNSAVLSMFAYDSLPNRSKKYCRSGHVKNLDRNCASGRVSGSPLRTGRAMIRLIRGAWQRSTPTLKEYGNGRGGMMVEWTASLRLRAALTAATPARLSLSGAQRESIISHSGGLNAF
jgi:hypothetical protein